MAKRTLVRFRVEKEGGTERIRIVTIDPKGIYLSLSDKEMAKNIFEHIAYQFARRRGMLEVSHDEAILIGTYPNWDEYGPEEYGEMTIRSVPVGGTPKKGSPTEDNFELFPEGVNVEWISDHAGLACALVWDSQEEAIWIRDTFTKDAGLPDEDTPLH